MAMNPGGSKRQKEKARQEKQQDKEARRQQRKVEKAARPPLADGEIPGVAEHLAEMEEAARRGER